MSLSKVKDHAQRESLRAWWRAGCLGTLELATGVGKTRCGILAIQHFFNQGKTILILAPTKTIRDRVWEKEFSKWGMSHIYPHVQIECIQTAYRWEGKTFGLVVVDEIHNALSTEYSKFFTNCKYDAILGLSATIPYRKRTLLNSIAPTVYKITTKEALDKKLVSPYLVYNVPVRLTDSEQRAYSNLCRVIDDLQERGVPAWKPIARRKQLLHGAKNKLKATKRIADLFKGRYGFVFAQYKVDVEIIADELAPRALYYHGGLTKKEEKTVIDSFCNVKSLNNILVAAKKLNEGADFPYVSFAIIHAGTSSALVQTQQLGRIIRLEEGKQAILVRLYIKDTQDESWLRNAQYHSREHTIYLEGVEELEEEAATISSV